jgi:hypothetical protein
LTQVVNSLLHPPYGASYGNTAATQVLANQKWIYLREDALLPLVEQ